MFDVQDRQGRCADAGALRRHVEIGAGVEASQRELDHDELADAARAAGGEAQVRERFLELCAEARGAIDPGVAAQIAQIEEQVAALRGIQPSSDVPNRVLSEEQLKQELQAAFDKENPIEQVRSSGELYQRLGLLPQGSDLRGLVLELLGSQVAGFYDPETNVFTLVQRAEQFGPADRIIVAHEFTHALQDMKFDLTASEIKDISEGDRALARTAFVEGDATLAMSVWALQNLTADEIQQVQNSQDAEQQAVLDRMPMLLRRRLLFPYFEGTTFAQQQFLAGGGFAGIDAAYAKLPQSTEQILHPEKYAAGEGPLEVKPEDLSGKLGEGWTRAIEETFGELGLQVYAANGVAPPEPAVPGLPPSGPIPGADAAAGWAGDRAASYNGPNGSWAVVWETAWDSAADADEFLAAAQAVTTVTAPHEVFTESDASRVTIVVASDQATLAQAKVARQP